MTPELTVLTLAALLQVVQFALMAVPANLEVGQGKTLSPRDRDRLGGSLEDMLSIRTARLYRQIHHNMRLCLSFRPHRLCARLCLWLDTMAQLYLVCWLSGHHGHAGRGAAMIFF
jgi:hypothetical protein